MHGTLQIVRTTPAKAGLHGFLADARFAGQFISVPDLAVRYRVACTSEGEPQAVISGHSTYSRGAVHAELHYSGKTLCFDADETGMVRMVSGSGLCPWTSGLVPARGLSIEQMFLTPYHHLELVNDLLAQRHGYANVQVRQSGGSVVVTLPARLVGRQTFARPQHIIQRLPDGALRFDYLLVRDDQAAAPGSYSVRYSGFHGPAGLPCEIRAVTYAANPDGRLTTSATICVDVVHD